MGFPFRIGLKFYVFIQMQSFVGVGVNMAYKYRVAFEILLEMLATSITPDCKYGAFKPKRFRSIGLKNWLKELVANGMYIGHLEVSDING